MQSVTINLSEKEKRILMKRAKNNLLSLREQVEDIIRRSCISSKNRGKRAFKTDDKLVEVFSRDRRGRKKKVKKKKK